MGKTPLLITVDTEGIGSEDSYHSVSLLDDFLDTLALPITLFVTPEVLEHNSSTVGSWSDQGHRVGLHIHPARLGGDSDWLASYPLSEIIDFIGRGCEVFKEAVGFEPLLFRAGRWSFSDNLLEGLGEFGFEFDSSHRPVDNHDPYKRNGVTEFPMTVYGNNLVRLLLSSRNIHGIPLHADAFLHSEPRSVVLYAATYLVSRQNRPYLMVSFHDYDLLDPRRRERILRYLARLSEWYDAATLPSAKREHKE